MDIDVEKLNYFVESYETLLRCNFPDPVESSTTAMKLWLRWLVSKTPTEEEVDQLLRYLYELSAKKNPGLIECEKALQAIRNRVFKEKADVESKVKDKELQASRKVVQDKIDKGELKDGSKCPKCGNLSRFWNGSKWICRSSQCCFPHWQGGGKSKGRMLDQDNGVKDALKDVPKDDVPF